MRRLKALRCSGDIRCTRSCNRFLRSGGSLFQRSRSFLRFIRWQRLELPETLPQGLLLLRRQCPETLEFLTDLCTFFWGEILPTLETFFGPLTLFRCHLLPALNATQQVFPTLFWQSIPFGLQRAKRLLLLTTQRIPTRSRCPAERHHNSNRTAVTESCVD